MKVKLDEGAFIPKRAHETDAGIDIFAREGQVVRARGRATFRTGVHVQLPPGACGIIVSKSGLNVNHDLTSTGLIDEGYTGEIVVKLYNHGDTDYEVLRGDKISQLVVISAWHDPLIEVVDEIEGGERGEHGFGSTGRS